MYVLSVIPVAKAVGKETLTYFTSEQVRPGMLVSVPIRSKIVPAIVTDVEDVRSVKSRVRALEHELRRVERLEARGFLHPSFITAAENIARVSAATTGSVLAALVPRPVLTHARELSAVPPTDARTSSSHSRAGVRTATTGVPLHEVLLVQAPEEERFAAYRRLIREEFARGQSVLIVAPTVRLAERLRDTLQKGIEQYTVLLHGTLSPRAKLIALWRQALADPHPILIVSTFIGLALPRGDIACCVLEEESSRHYKLAARPFLDIRTALEIVSRTRGARAVFGGMILRVETLERFDRHDAHALVPPTLRYLTAARVSFVDMTRENKEMPPRDARTLERVVFSGEARALIARGVKAGENLVVFAVRRGLATLTICGDCERIVACRRCSAAVVLHSAPRRNVFRCHRCGDERDAQETCTNCGSWKLVPLGIGTERLREAVRAIAPHATITPIDSDAIPTARAAQKAADLFLSSRGGVLVATGMALPYLTGNVEHVIVASLDTLFALPDFRMNERVFRLILALRSRATTTFLLQTRMSSQSLFRHALEGHVSNFLREELEERERFGYPPFTTLIKISRAGDIEPRDGSVSSPWGTRARADMERLRALITPYEPVVYAGQARGHQAPTHALIKVPRDRWPDEALLRALRSLPLSYAIDVNPESIV